MEAKKRKKTPAKAKKGTKARKPRQLTEGIDEPVTAPILQEPEGAEEVIGFEDEQRVVEGAPERDIVSIAGPDSDLELETDDEEPAPKKMKTPPNITAYIDIVNPPRSTKSKETTVTRGPFFFTTETTHFEFLQLIASAATEKNIPIINSINQAQLLWKLNVPANDKKKLLTNEQGYQALIAILKNRVTVEKSKDSSITVIMPPLLKNTSSVST